MKIKKIKTYIEGLDEKMEGGIPYGHVVLVCGPAGSMKTSVVFNMLYNYAKEGQGKVIYISLEQRKPSLSMHLKEMGMDPEEVKDKLLIMDLGWLRREIKDVSEGEQVPWMESLKFQIKTYKEKSGYNLIALDSLDALYVLANMKEPREELFHFFEDLRDAGVTSLLISEMQDTGHFGKYGVETFLADGIIHLAMERTGRTVGRYVSVVKMRAVKHATDYFPLLVDKQGFKIVKR